MPEAHEGQKKGKLSQMGKTRSMTMMAERDRSRSLKLHRQGIQVYVRVHVHGYGRWGGYSEAAQLLLYPRLTGLEIVWGCGERDRETENMKLGLFFYEGPSIGSLGFLRLSLFTNLKNKNG